MEGVSMGTNAPVRTVIVVPRRAEPLPKVIATQPHVVHTDRLPCPARRVQLPAAGSVGEAFG